MKNKEYILAVKKKYIEESGALKKQFSDRFQQAGMAPQEIIDGVVTDIFFAYFNEDI